MKEKYFLTEDDIRKLPMDQQVAYNEFMQTVQHDGIVYKAQLEKFDEVLKNQYANRVLFNPNANEIYPEILAKNLHVIIEKLVNFRNGAIKEEKAFDQFHFSRVLEGLDVLTEFINKNLNSYHYGNSLVSKELEILLPMIEQLKLQINKDLQYYQGYLQEKSNAIDEYRDKKEAYDRLSTFGKIAARINGKKKELDEAARRNAYYGFIQAGIAQPGMLDNPYQYNEYIKNQQPSNDGSKTR